MLLRQIQILNIQKEIGYGMRAAQIIASKFYVQDFPCEKYMNFHLIEYCLTELSFKIKIKSD